MCVGVRVLYVYVGVGVAEWRVCVCVVSMLICLLIWLFFEHFNHSVFVFTHAQCILVAGSHSNIKTTWYELVLSTLIPAITAVP